MTATTQPVRATARKPAISRKPRRSKKDVAGLLIIGVPLLLPFVPLLVWSFSATWFYPELVPTRFSLRSWEYLFSSASGVIPGFLTSLVIGLTVAFIAALIGLTSGRALGLHSFRGKGLVMFLVMAPVIVPPLTVAMGIEIVFIKLHLANTIPGVILVQLVPTIPYVTLVMSSVYANFDTAFEDQARVLGASMLRTFWYVTLPAVFPGLVVAALFAFLLAWAEYIMTLLIGGGEVQTLPLILFSFATSDLSIASALSIVFIVPAIVILFFSSRFLSGDRTSIGGFGRL